MTAPATLACPRCATPLVTLAPGASVGQVAVQCTRCGHWLTLGQGPGAPQPRAAPPPGGGGWPPAPPPTSGWSPLPATLAGPGPAAAGIGLFDWIVAGAGTAGALALAALGVALRHFRAVFASTGGELPALTRVVMGAGVPFVLALLAVALAMAGLALRRAGSAAGRPLLLLSVAVTLVGAPLCLISMYLPIFSLADAIK